MCMKKNKNNFNNIMINILLFFTFSIIGWIWEVIYEIIRGRGFSNRGVLFGPWLPIYGFCAMLIYILLKKFKSSPNIIFIGSFIICSIIEYITSWYLETISGIRWWDYSEKLFNINGRICLSGSIFFGIMICFILYLVIPKLRNLFEKTPKRIMVIICIFLVSTFTIDLIYSSNHPNLNKGVKIIDNDLFKRINK